MPALTPPGGGVAPPSGGAVPGTDFVGWTYDASTKQYTYYTANGSSISSALSPDQVSANGGKIPVGNADANAADVAGKTPGGAVKKKGPLNSFGDAGSAIGGPFSKSQLNAIDKVTGVVTSIPDFLSLITSGNFWDRVLFIFGGLVLVIVGLVLLLHKSIPIPPVIPV